MVGGRRPSSKELSFDEDAWSSSSSAESGEETDELSPKDGAGANRAARASEGRPITRQLPNKRSGKNRPKALDDESRSVTSNKSVNSKKSQLGKKSVATNNSAAKNQSGTNRRDTVERKSNDTFLASSGESTDLDELIVDR
jgi:hypothetical protein